MGGPQFPFVAIDLDELGTSSVHSSAVDGAIIISTKNSRRADPVLGPN
jgi:hypothetical protein